jgi:hexosaminidase
MVAVLKDGFTLRSVWEQSDSGGRYRLILTNNTKSDVANFRLGLSGPLRISASAEITNGKVVTQLSNYAELSPAGAYVLQPGASWEVSIDKLDFPLRHWTDGATTGFVIYGDGRAVPAITMPTELPDSPAYRRGTMKLGGDPTVPVSIIPWPNKIEVAGRRTSPQGLSLAAGGAKAALAAKDAFGELVGLLFPG